MPIGVDKKLARKDPDLRRFIVLCRRAMEVIDRPEDSRYIANYVNGLIAGGNTWMRAQEHFVTGIHIALMTYVDRDPAAAAACAMVEEWEKAKGLHR